MYNNRYQELYHHGILGQKWGVRRYQNADGSYKPGAEGRYNGDSSGSGTKSSVSKNNGNSSSSGAKNTTKNLYSKTNTSMSESDKRKQFKKEQDMMIRRSRKNNSYEWQKAKWDEIKDKTLDQYVESKLQKHKSSGFIRTKADKEYYTNVFKNEYKAAKKVESQNAPVSKEHRTALKKEFKKETQSLIDDLKSAEYGSDKWFEKREQYFKKLDSYSEKYCDSLLKDYGMESATSYTRDWAKTYFGTDDLAKGYVNGDYRHISNPVTGDRDYNLEDKYYAWANRK